MPIPALVPLVLALAPLVPQETATPAALEPALWTQWRGPGRDGLAPAEPVWPGDLRRSLVQRWEAKELGPSYAGPIVAADRVFSVETLDATREVVRAFDRASGKELWSQSWEGAMKVPFFAARNGSWIRATPAFDGRTLFVAGMRDVLVALDGEDGEIRWKVDFVERNDASLPDFGCASSPLLVGDDLYVQAGAALSKLDKHTGETRWKTLSEHGGMDSSFSSPILCEVAGREQLLVQSRSHLMGVAPEDGAVLWEIEIETFRGMNILTPVVWGDAVFTSAYGGRGQRIDVVAGDEGFQVARRWDNKAQAYMSSPVVLDGYAYLFLRSNRFSCVDLATGEQTWVSPPTGLDYCSLVAQGERILALGNTGTLSLLAADPGEYRLLDELEIAEEETWAHLAVAGEQVFVRSSDALLAYDWKPAPASGE